MMRTVLDQALRYSVQRFAVKTRCQRIEQKPPGENRTMPTFEVKIGYQVPGDPHYADFERSAKPSSQVVKLEISINDVVCEFIGKRLSELQQWDLRVCVLEDILAEKLRALLQQPSRNRHRQQDPMDIANMLRKHGSEIDRRKIAEYLLLKCQSRGIEARKSAFDDDIRARAYYQYETLFSSTEPDFIPFDQAWRDVTTLVSMLAIPD